MKESAELLPPVRPRFKPYPVYKDSGVEWLGEIPAHWEVKRLWHLTPSDRRIMYGIVLPGPNVDDGVPIVKGGDVSPERLRLDRLNRTTSEIESGYVRSRLRGGDLVYAIRGSIGEVAIVPGELEGANLTQDAARIAFTTATHGPWLLHALKSAAVFAQLEGGALGATIRGINIRDLKRASLPVPPRVEQEAIAGFLESETARIDALVAKKERLIELLHEKRTALITRATTKGLDPNVPMKDSGVEWLGEIPAHWEVMKTPWLFSIGSGTTPRSDDPGYYGGETPWITTAELRESMVLSTEKNVTDEALKELSSLKVHPKGSIAVAMYGATIGRLGILGVPAAVNQACCVFSNPQRIETWFWFYWLQMRRPHLISLGYGGGQPNLSQDLLRSIRVPTPPPSEQQAITAFLDRETARIDALVAKVRDAIDRLKELRTALISAAVTGKFDVREEVA